MQQRNDDASAMHAIQFIFIIVMNFTSFLTFLTVITLAASRQHQIANVQHFSTPRYHEISVANVIPDDYVCVAMDWWPKNKCNYGYCPWENASVLTVQFDHTLGNFMKAFAPVMLRIGGSMTDKLSYQIDSSDPCIPFQPEPPANASFFTNGCLTADRWTEILQFCHDYGCKIVLDINAMRGREDINDPNWDSSNAKKLIRFTAGLSEDLLSALWGFEYGNELPLSADIFAKGLRELNEIVVDSFADKEYMPRIVGPAEVKWDSEFFSNLIVQVDDFLHAITWHKYPLGPGYQNPKLEEKIMDPSGLDEYMEMARNASEVARRFSKTGMEVWMGESGGCYNSGHMNMSNRFMDAFWYMDSLGGFARYGHSRFCRQAFIGGNYELIDRKTMIPNPDYYGALLFRRLMGEKVLDISSSEKSLHIWSHCLKGSDTGAIALLLLNYNHSSLSISSVSDIDVVPRQEYIMTADELHSQYVSLNGQKLVMVNDELPELTPRVVDDESTFSIPAQSYAFIILSEANVALCK